MTIIPTNICNTQFQEIAEHVPITLLLYHSTLYSTLRQEYPYSFSPITHGFGAKNIFF